MMNNEVKYILDDNERLILLLRSEDDKDREKNFDQLSKNQEELRRLWNT